MMRPHLLGLAAVLTVLPIAVGLAVPRPTPKASGPDPYADTVRRVFIEGKQPLLRYDGPASNIPVRLQLDSKQEQELAFVRNSYLRQDLRAQDPTTWRYSGTKVIDIAPDRYRDLLPSRRAAAWTGAVLFAPPAAAAGDRLGWQQGQPIALISDRPNCPPAAIVHDDRPLKDIDVDLVTYRCTLGAASRFPGRIDLVCPMPGGSGEVLVGRIVRVGDALAVSSLRNGSQCSVRLNGVPLPVGSWYALSETARLTVHGGAGADDYHLVRPPPRAPDRALSWIDRSGQRRAAPQLAPLATALGVDLARAVAAGAAVKNAITTTLDGDLQQEVQDQVSAWVKDLRAAAPSQAGDPAAVAAVTIMNASTGAVRVLAGTDESAPAQIPGKAVDPNFQLLPVGSTMKPLIAAAILTDDFDLSNLCLNVGAEQLETLLGLRLSPPLGTEKGNGIGFDTFISLSNNAYMGAMILLASPANGQPVTRTVDFCQGAPPRPASIYEVPGPKGSFRENPVRVGPTPMWQRRLSGLFGLNSGAQAVQACPDDGDRSDPYRDFAPWRHLGPGVGASFDAAAPRRERLDLNATDTQYRSGVLMTALGNNNGNLATIKLAEAYARLLTDSCVTATLQLRSGAPGATAWPEAAATAGARLRQAMAKVLIANGTGTDASKGVEALRQILAADGVQLTVYGKTGTPTLPVTIEQDIAALTTLAEQGHLERQGATVVAGVPLSVSQKATLDALNLAQARSGSVFRFDGNAEQPISIICQQRCGLRQRSNSDSKAFVLGLQAWRPADNARVTYVVAVNLRMRWNKQMEWHGGRSAGKNPAAALAGDIARRLAPRITADLGRRFP